MSNNPFVFKITDAATAELLNRLLRGLCDQYHLKPADAKAVIQKALRDMDVLNMLADAAKAAALEE